MHNLQLRNLLSAVALSALLPLSLTACDDGGSGGSGSGDGSTGGASDTNDTNDTNDAATVTVTDTTPTTVTDTTPTTGDTDPTTGADTTDTEATTGDTEGPTTGDTDEPTTGGTDTTTGDTDGTSSSTGEETTETTGTTLECAQENLGDGAPVNATADNTGAGDDITLSCVTGGEDVLFEYTSAEAGIYIIDTYDSAIDTGLGVIAGCDGEELACNDDSADNVQSEIILSLEATTDYIIAVDSYDGEVGAINVNVDYLGETSLPATLCEAAGDPLAACDSMPQMMPMMTYGATLACGSALYYDIFEIDVTEGDCIYLRADNIDPVAGATGMEAADLRMFVVDANGDISSFDDEFDCTDPTFGGDFGCPEASVTASSTGTMSVLIAQYGGEGCPDAAPYSFNAEINGAEVDLSGGPATPEVVGVCL